MEEIKGLSREQELGVEKLADIALAQFWRCRALALGIIHPQPYPLQAYLVEFNKECYFILPHAYFVRFQ